MNRLWSVYHKEIPEFLWEFAQTPPLLRLKHVGMNCGCEYTGFPRFSGLAPYSRYAHSMGAALIVWHFTASCEQALSALFHDVTTPVFAHVVDFLNGDHVKQESTEAGVAERLAASPELCGLLEKYQIRLEAVADYHRYPIADNDSPALSADRLEYTMGNLLNYGFASVEELRALYDDLTVGTDEAGRPELVFRHRERAAEFARLALCTARIYVADEDRFAMESLAQLLRQALERHILQRSDLDTTEPQVIGKLTKDPQSRAEWERFCGYSALRRQDTPPAETGWLRVEAKRRWIDPLAAGSGRVSAWDGELRRDMEIFRNQSFAYWLRAE